MKVVRQARLELSGGSTPDLLRPLLISNRRGWEGGKGTVTLGFPNLIRRSDIELLLCVCWLDKVIGAFLCTSNFLHSRHYTVPCIMQNTSFFAISAMNVGPINTYSLLSISNVQEAVLCLPRIRAPQSVVLTTG